MKSTPTKQRLKDTDLLKRNTKERINLAQRIKSARFVDRLEGWETRRGIFKYQNLLRVDFDAIKKKLLTRKNRIRVLDIGCGPGYFLSEFKKGNKKIITHGLRVNLEGSPHLGDVKTIDKTISAKIDNLHIGSFENYKFKHKFDLIVSAIGSVYTASQAHTIWKVCSLLNVGGVAAINIPKKGVSKGLIEKLNKSGYEARVLTTIVTKRTGEKMRLRILHIKKTQNKVLDLSEFIEKELKKGISPTVEERIQEFA